MAHRSIRRRSSKTTATFVELGRATGVFAPGLKLPSGRLNQVRHASLRQLWAERAARLGWDAMALFGCPPKRPLDYFGSAGLLWAINGGRLVELHRDWAVIDVPVHGSQRTFYRRNVDAAKTTLPWARQTSSRQLAALGRQGSGSRTAGGPQSP